MIALETARTALDAAIQRRKYQEQQQGYLAQANSTEVAARSIWTKTRVALDRSVGNLLETDGITFSDSVLGHFQLVNQHSPNAVHFFACTIGMSTRCSETNQTCASPVRMI